MHNKVKVRHLLRPFIILCLFLITATTISSSIAAPEDAENNKRRVNIPHFSGTPHWDESAVFWFGENGTHTANAPNYTDVRVYYTNDTLQVRFTVVDYRLWYNPGATVATDLTEWDAVALYLDTNQDGATTPQSDDYIFMTGGHTGTNHTPYKRQGRGNGSSWGAWSGSWTNWGTMSTSLNGVGPNNNSDLDFGWTGGFAIPFSSLGISGPPSEGTVWGVGVQLFDKDSSTGILTPEVWPENFDEGKPSTWAEFHFGDADYESSNETMTGSTTIRSSSPTDNTVEDSWMGGNGLCNGGHEGDNEANYGDDTRLFVGTETAETHFPCFNKSYLRFSLDDVPDNKVILSATMTLHLWGNADPTQAQPSWMHLFSIKDNWNEMSIHWNNAPMAFENIDAIWVNPYSQQTIEWPGDPYSWNATQAVAEAYAEGDPVSFALYGSDTEQHSSKYMTSSEIGNWNAEGRPTLVIEWGNAGLQTELSKTASTPSAEQGETIEYTISFKGIGEVMSFVDDLPTGVSAPTDMDAGLNYSGHQISWNGSPAVGELVTLSYSVTVATGTSQALINEVTLSPTGETAAVTVLANPISAFLPFVTK